MLLLHAPRQALKMICCSLDFCCMLVLMLMPRASAGPLDCQGVLALCWYHNLCV